jgi:hypothetical protein
MGLVVGPDRGGRGFLNDRQGRFRAPVAAQAALPIHRYRLHPFTGSAPEQNNVGPGMLAKIVAVRDPWRSNTACE